jgi:nitroreductase
MSLDNLKIVDKLEWRYATKVFDPTKKISTDKWEVLENSLLLSPSSYGLQPWKFLVIENKQIREKLKPVSWNQTQITDASHLVVFTTRKDIDGAFIRKYIDRIAEVRGVSVDSLKAFEDIMNNNIVKGMSSDYKLNWMQRQAYIAMGFLLETAALIDVDAVPLEGLDPQAYDEILGLTNSEYRTVAAVALGYRSSDDKYQSLTKVRFKKEDIVQRF